MPKELVSKIDKHFEFFWQNDKLLELTTNDRVLTRLPKPIRHEVFHKIINIFYFFGDHEISLRRGFSHIPWLFADKRLYRVSLLL